MVADVPAAHLYFIMCAAGEGGRCLHMPPFAHCPVASVARAFTSTLAVLESIEDAGRQLQQIGGVGIRSFSNVAAHKVRLTSLLLCVEALCFASAGLAWHCPFLQNRLLASTPHLVYFHVSAQG
jgi:hypothetical protein